MCESLLMVEAYNANVICPNKQASLTAYAPTYALTYAFTYLQVDDSNAAFDGHLLESETLTYALTYVLTYVLTYRWTTVTPPSTAIS